MLFHIKHKTTSLIMQQKLLVFATPFFGIPLWVLLVSSTAAFIVVLCIIMSICFIYYYYPRSKSYKPSFSLPKSIACKHNHLGIFSYSSLEKGLLSASSNLSELEINFDKLKGYHEVVNCITKDGYLKGFFESSGEFSPVANDVRRGCCFSFKEIEDATNGLDKENVIGSGANGIVFLGMLPNNSQVAVKRLVCDSQHEECFASQMEEIGRAEHKNLVKLVGYCTEDAHRMLVSEYVENGNLHYWLHEFSGQISPLTWTMRFNIIHGVAKGLAYLHGNVEPKILHGSIKASNILLDHQWNPKISDFGLAKLLNPEWSHITMEALGDVSPDCHSTSTFTEGNDIYDYGLLIMEIISGRIPLDYSQPQALIVDWFKSMICSGKIDCLVDPKLPEIPSSIEVKRFILVALRCVDVDVNPRIKMGDVVTMLETNLLLFDEHQIAMEE